MLKQVRSIVVNWMRFITTTLEQYVLDQRIPMVLLQGALTLLDIDISTENAICIIVSLLTLHPVCLIRCNPSLV